MGITSSPNHVILQDKNQNHFTNRLPSNIPSILPCLNQHKSTGLSPPSELNLSSCKPHMCFQDHSSSLLWHNCRKMANLRVTSIRDTTPTQTSNSILVRWHSRLRIRVILLILATQSTTSGPR